MLHIIKQLQPEVGQIPIGMGKFRILEHHLLREQKIWDEKLIWEKKEATQCDEETTSLAMPEISIGETKKTYYNHKVFTVPKTKSVWRLEGVNATIVYYPDRPQNCKFEVPSCKNV